jgi:hypothetical protein
MVICGLALARDCALSGAAWRNTRVLRMFGMGLGTGLGIASLIIRA